MLQRTLSERLHGCLCSLTDPPQDGSTLHLTADIISQRGNAVNIAQHIVLGPREQFFTAATYGVQYTTVVNITGALSQLVKRSIQPWTEMLRAIYSAPFPQLQMMNTAFYCCLGYASQLLAAETGVPALISLMESGSLRLPACAKQGNSCPVS